MKRHNDDSTQQQSSTTTSSNTTNTTPTMTPFDVRTYLTNVLSFANDGHEMFAPLADGKLVMPKQATDGRSLTWHKTILTVAKKIVNTPTSDMDCWFVQANHGRPKSDHITKLSADGSKNKWFTVRILYVILHPDEHSKVNNRDTQKDLYCLHRCGKGKGSPLCINPNHIKLSTTKQNRHDERCGHGCHALCPHNPKCVFTWKDTGLQKLCLNKKTYNSETCNCVPKCSHADSVLEKEKDDDTAIVDKKEEEEEKDKNDEDE